jgi:hypothetical protein
MVSTDLKRQMRAKLSRLIYLLSIAAHLAVGQYIFLPSEAHAQVNVRSYTRKAALVFALIQDPAQVVHAVAVEQTE